MIYWPGTKIVKSYGNAFNWREEPSEVTSTKEFKASVAAKRNTHMQKSRQFTVYSKAQASK
jgi:hypothetical protein